MANRITEKEDKGCGQQPEKELPTHQPGISKQAARMSDGSQKTKPSRASFIRSSLYYFYLFSSKSFMSQIVNREEGNPGDRPIISGLRR